MWKKRPGLNIKGSVLIISLLILSAMLILGISSIFTSSLDMKIASNTKTSTRALYAADSGMNMAKKDLLDNAASRFIYTVPDIDNTTDHIVVSGGAASGKTLRKPENWDPTKTSFPFQLEYTVDGKTARAVIPAPVWEGTLPGVSADNNNDPNYFTLTFLNVTSTELDSGIRIAANIRMWLGNNLLFFQNNPTESSPSVDVGIDASEGDIEGVATNGIGVNADATKILIIYKLESTTSSFEIFGEPCRNTTSVADCTSPNNTANYTFKLADSGWGQVYYHPKNTPAPDNWFVSLTINPAGEPTIKTVVRDVGAYTSKRLPVTVLLGATRHIDVVSGATISTNPPTDRGLSSGDQFRIEVRNRSSLSPQKQLQQLEELNAVPFSTLGAACNSVPEVAVDCSTLTTMQWKFYNN